MAQILRGDIYWADLDPTKGHEQSGQRPVLILSNDIFNQRSGTVIAMALTSQPQRAGFPPHAGTGRREPAETILGENQPDSHAVRRAIEPENRTGQTGGSGTGHHGTEPNRRSMMKTQYEVQGGPHFPVPQKPFGEGGCSMKLTEDVRKYAAEQGIAEEEALKMGMEEKSREFTEKGSELYAKA